MSEEHPFKLLVVCPHFDPDTAPTGVVMSRIVSELAQLGHEVHVVTSLPWYRHHRVEEEWSRIPRNERTTDVSWGSITRVDPFAGKDKGNLLRRALGFIGFSLLGAVAAVRIALRRRVDAVLVMSPPLTLGLSAKVAAILRRVPLVLNIQDVFPDAAIETGMITNPVIIRLARVLENATYRASTVITVLSDDLRDNVRAKLPSRSAHRVEVIPNFVDVRAIAPRSPDTPYRRELGLDDRPVVMYAGNIGFSQSLELLIEAARTLPDVAFVINGTGAARERLEAMEVPNVVFGDYQPADRLAEVLCTANVHVIPLRSGLGRVSVPSKTYSIMAAGRPILAAIDLDTEVPRLVQRAGAGIVVPPDDFLRFHQALVQMLGDPVGLETMGKRAREYVESIASPHAVAERYVDVIRSAIRERTRG